MGVYLSRENWYIDYCHNGQRYREKIGPDKKLAETVLRKRRVEIAEEKFLDIKRFKKIKFSDFAQTYLERHAKPHKRGWKKGDAVSIKHLNNCFGEKFLFDIKPLMIEDYKNKRRETMAPSSVNKEIACIKVMFSKAVEWELASENPAKRVKLFKADNSRVRYLDREEIATLLSNSSDRLKKIIIFAISTGMRKGEIQNMRWADINFNNDIITLPLTKNGEVRYVPMSTNVKEMLLNMKEHSTSEIVFCNEETGARYDFRETFRTARRKANIANFRFHDLRHTFASHLVMAGVDLNTVRELLGHKSLDMTLRYSHLSQDHKKRAVELLDSKTVITLTPPAPTALALTK